MLTEPQALHVVSSLIEMPEGASISDTDDKDQNDVDDPHRALDIDLEMYVQIQSNFLNYSNIQM